MLVAETSPQDELPLLIFYDCESTCGNIHSGHIIEVCGEVFPISDAVAISKPEYSSLIHSSRTIMKVVEKVWHNLTDTFWSSTFWACS